MAETQPKVCINLEKTGGMAERVEEKEIGLEE